MNASIFRSWPEISTMIWSALTSTIRARKIWTRACNSARMRGRGVDLDQHQVTLDEIRPGDVEHLDDGDDLLELLADLLEQPVVAVDHDGDPRQVGVLGLADGEALDVEPPRREHPGNVRQDPRLVLHQRRQHMPHPTGSTTRIRPHRSTHLVMTRPTTT